MELEGTESSVEIRRGKEQQQKLKELPGPRSVRERIPSMANFLFIFIVTCSFLYKGMTSGLFYLVFRLVFGTLYPAYASYKAVRTKNVKEYVKWMMYWIVFALFSCAETFTDVFLSWFPFYYEIKIILVLWLLSPATKGSSILYRKFVHPTLSKREQEIDDYINKAKEQGYHTVLNLGTKGVNYATNVIMQTAIKGGGGIVNQIRKSYSLSDLSQTDHDDHGCDEADDVIVSDPRLMRRRRSPRRSASGSPKVDMYFSEVDLRQRSTGLDHIRSTEDISSGYSSAEPLYGAGQMRKAGSRESLVRSGSLNSGTVRPRTRSTRSSTAITAAAAAASKKGASTEESGLSEDDVDTSSEFDNVVTVIKKTSKQIENVIKTEELIIPPPNECMEKTTIKAKEHIELPVEEQSANIAKSEESKLPALSRSSSEEGDFFDTVERTETEQKVDNELLIDNNETLVTNTVSVLNGNEGSESQNTNTVTSEHTNENLIGNVANVEIITSDIPHAKEKTIEKADVENKEEKEEPCHKIDLGEANSEPSTQNASIPIPVETEHQAASVTLQDTNNEVPCQSADQKDVTPKLSDGDEQSLCSVSSRAGKYHKKTAPSPPEMQSPKTQTVTDTCHQPVKATLVLKPGIVKPIDSPSKSEIFISRSPKPKRKESTSPIAKLKLLPKKLNFWHHKEQLDVQPEPETNKHASWHQESIRVDLLEPPAKCTLDREQSKSNEVLISLRSEKSDEGGDERVIGNLTLRQLSESPSRRRSKED